MTVDDLMTLFQSARQGTRDWNGTEWVGVYGGDRAGVTAIVRALRDETRHMTLNRDGLEELFTQILGSDAEEKVAEGIAERADEQRADAPATDPIRDAVAMARGRVLVVDDIPMLNKLAATMSPATDLTVGQRLIKAAKEAAAIARGEVSDPSYTGGMNDLCVTDAAPACEWRVGKDPAGYSCYYSDCTAGWRGLRANFCPTCKRPVKIVEPEPDPAPAVCVWEYRLCPADITIGSAETECGLSLTGPMFRPKFNVTACTCGKPIRFREVGK